MKGSFDISNIFKLNKDLNSFLNKEKPADDRNDKEDYANSFPTILL